MTNLDTLRAARAPLASFAAMGVLWGAYAGMVPATKAQLSVDDSTWGLLFLCSSSAAVFAMLFAPRIGAALGGRVLPVVTFVMGLAFALPGHMTQVIWFIPCMMLLGMSSGSLDVLMNARVSAIETERGLHLMNLSHGAYSFAYAAGAAATGIARGAGLGPAQVLTGAACIAMLMALLTVERDGRIPGLGRRREDRAGALGVLPVVGGFVILIAFLSENAAEAWSALHIERTLGGAPGFGSYGPALLGLTMGVGRMFGQVLVARLSEAVLLRWGTLVAAVGAVVAALAPTPMVAYGGFVILGAGVSVIAPVALALIGRLVDPRLRTQAIARASMLGYLGYFFGPPALGAISSLFGLRIAFGVVALVLLGLLPLVPVMLRGRVARA